MLPLCLRSYFFNEQSAYTGCSDFVISASAMDLSSSRSQIKLLLHYTFWLFVCVRTCLTELSVYTGCSYFIIGMGAMDLSISV